MVGRLKSALERGLEAVLPAYSFGVLEHLSQHFWRHDIQEDVLHSAVTLPDALNGYLLCGPIISQQSLHEVDPGHDGRPGVRVHACTPGCVLAPRISCDQLRKLVATSFTQTIMKNRWILP